MSEDVMTGTWKFVGQGNDRAYVKALGGDIAGALADLDKIRDEALKMETDVSLHNEIECRRLEFRLHINARMGDLKDLIASIRDIGQSNRFTAERLHELLDLIGAYLEERRKGAG